MLMECNKDISVYKHKDNDQGLDKMQWYVQLFNSVR